MATSTVLEARVGETYSFSPARPASPKLGDFSKIFDIVLSSASKVTNPPARPLSRPSSPSPILHNTTYDGPKLFGALDLSKLASPAKSSLSSEDAAATSSSDCSSAKRSIASTSGISHTPGTTPPSSSEKDVVDPKTSARETDYNPHMASGTSTVDLDIDSAFNKLMGRLNTQRGEEDAGLTGAPFNATQQVLYIPNTSGTQIQGHSMPMVSPVGPIYVDPQSYAYVVPWASAVSDKPTGGDMIYPLWQADHAGQKAILQASLREEYKYDQWLQSTAPGAPAGPIHIFVDLSNIIIGFYDCMKLRRGLPLNKRIKAPPFFFENFACILERDRSVAKKIVAGSVVNAWGAWPEYMNEAEKCGYEMNILQRITRNSHTPKRKTMSGNLADTTTSGGDSSDDALAGTTKRSYPLKHGEQGVDELLHLKIAQSILDHQPSTMVLATGDAAEAEYSDGFLKNVERALERGWYVELVAWSKGISFAWKNKNFAKKWGHQFRVIELDDFAEELLAWYGRPMPQTQHFVSRPTV
ncbi:hypothetical protein NKR23_g9983 [Pleurostoma richardsiae]|uniref:NYN domain-containing protein n=1 Tax=Pleurostoma richardsiae TaxID=41990 RepID=A0AA38VEK8_9PEZI|nr:hypothetical protein NKR23_g9983 [Pleurostoma richardsiae]